MEYFPLETSLLSRIKNTSQNGIVKLDKSSYSEQVVRVLLSL